jgi:hypothetical protein
VGGTIFVGGISTKSLSWETVTFSGTFNDKAHTAAWVVSMADNGSSPTLNWGQWLGGAGNDQVTALAHSGILVYAGGWSTNSLTWQTITFSGQFAPGSSTEGWVVSLTNVTGTGGNNSVLALASDATTVYAGGWSVVSFPWESVAFNGTFNDTGSAGFVVSFTDNGGTPTLNWGQWIGGGSTDEVLALADDPSLATVYAAGLSTSSLLWETVNFVGTFNNIGTTGGFVVSITDNGSAPTLNWGEWLGGEGVDEVLALSDNTPVLYGGGISTDSTSWQTVAFYGTFNDAATAGFVVSMTDNGSDTTLNWGQWLGGNGSDEVVALTNNSSTSTIYASGWSTASTLWETVDFNGTFNDKGGTAGFVMSIVDNGANPVLYWGQWIGGRGNDEVLTVAQNSTSVYAGGWSTVSTSWETVAFKGTFNDKGGTAGFVVSIADNGTNSTLNWGQWLGGGGNDQVTSLTNNGGTVFVGGTSTASTSWQTLTFGGAFNDKGGTAGWVVTLTDNGSVPTLNWGQWLGGGGNDQVTSVEDNGTTLYIGGSSTNSLSWETISFSGDFVSGSPSEGWLVSLTNNITPVGSGNNQITAMAANATTIYAGGWSLTSDPWASVIFSGKFNDVSGNSAGFVVSMTDSGATPTINWGQWLGGGSTDIVFALVNNSTTIYAAGSSKKSISWETVSFYGTFKTASSAGFVVSLTDNGSSPTLNWGQWLDGTNDDTVAALANSGTSVYAGGYSSNSTSWETVTFNGTFNDTGNSSGFVVKMSDNGRAPTLNWGQWLGGGGNGGGDRVLSLTANGTTVYAGGKSQASTSWQTVTFYGTFNDNQSFQSNGVMVAMTDNGSSPTLNWGAWIGGTGSNTHVDALAHNGAAIYGVGSTSASGWALPIYGRANSASAYLIRLTDNGSRPTFNWVEYIGQNLTQFNGITVNGTTVYAGGYSSASTSWASVSFYGTFNDAGNSAGFVASVTDNGANNPPALNWVQWLGGSGLDKVMALANNGSTVYAGGFSTASASWETITFSGTFASGSMSQGWVVSLTDTSNGLTGTGQNSITALARNSTTIYAAGYSNTKTPWASVIFQGVFNSDATGTGGFVVSMTDSGGTPTLNWGQWLVGGAQPSQVAALANNATTIYAGGFTTTSLSWSTLTFYGTYNSTSSSNSVGFVISMTDNGSTPTLNWGQWVGGRNSNRILALANNSTTIYAGGWSQVSTSWTTVTFYGTFNSSGTDGFVVSMTDNGSSPTLNWGQWLSGGGGDNSILALTHSGTTVYAGGYSGVSVSWETVTLYGFINKTNGNPSGIVVKMSDNGSSPTLNWGQWLAGQVGDKVLALTNNTTTVYAGGYSQSSLRWETVSFNGTFNDIGASAGWVVSMTDNNSSPTLNWGQWVGGHGNDTVTALTHNGTTIYAGGWSTVSTSWESTTFYGTFNDVGGTAAWVVAIADNGPSSSLKWGQWLGGSSNDQVTALVDNGTLVYVGGWSTNSTSWDTVTFSGDFYAGSTSEGFVIKLSDAVNASNDNLFWGGDF